MLVNGNGNSFLDYMLCLGNIRTYLIVSLLLNKHKCKGTNEIGLKFMLLILQIKLKRDSIKVKAEK